LRNLAAALALLLAAGCASFDGRGLQPGKATAEEVRALMGSPALELKRPDGETHLYYERYLTGPAMFVARIGADGRLRGIEQRLTYENIHAVKEGMRAGEVRALLGPPFGVSRFPRLQHDVWEYPWRHAVRELRVLFVHFSDDGVARRIVERHDYERDPEDGPFP
jgi:outer membrane protein assembly factor BamE (lipoprotein component of BamABCDE complex)